MQCSIACNSQNFNFYGTVNEGTTSVDCMISIELFPHSDLIWSLETYLESFDSSEVSRAHLSSSKNNTDCEFLQAIAAIA